MALHDKAIPRPWSWEWDALNNIVIYQVTTGLHSTVVAEVGIEDSESDEEKRQAEDTADLIVTLVNREFGEEELDREDPLSGQQQSLKENLRGQEQDDG